MRTRPARRFGWHNLLEIYIHDTFLEVGGRVIQEDQLHSTNPNKKVVASMLIVKAKTIDEVRHIIESDIYIPSGVVSSWWHWHNNVMAHRFTYSGTRTRWSFCRLSLLPRSQSEREMCWASSAVTGK